MSTKARTPEHFPQMKVRGSQRRKLAPWQKLAGAYSRLGEAASYAAMQMKALAVATRKD